jgi:hypothetical protein
MILQRLFDALPDWFWSLWAPCPKLIGCMTCHHHFGDGRISLHHCVAFAMRRGWWLVASSSGFPKFPDWLPSLNGNMFSFPFARHFVSISSVWIYHMSMQNVNRYNVCYITWAPSYVVFDIQMKVTRKQTYTNTCPSWTVHGNLTDEV